MSRPLWQNPTAIVTALAVIATIALIIVVNSRPAVPNNPAVLNPPAAPVADSIPRQGALLGSSTAPVKMDAWEDYQCPYCDVWTEQWEPHVIQDFVATGILSYQFHDFAFLGQESVDAAVAAQCAGDQGEFWQYHGWLYANQDSSGENQGWFTRARLDAIALKVGLNQATFDTCLADPAKATAVEAERQAGAALGVNETPSIFINDKLQNLDTYQSLSATIRAFVPAGSPVPSSSPGAVPSPFPSGSATP